MTIRFTKGHCKPDTLTCRRNDGSCTWIALNLPAAHDFGHYAIETTLGFQEAFFGLLAQGWAIQDFGRPDPETGRRRQVPREAMQAEVMAGLIDMERRSAKLTAYGEFLELLASACAGFSLPLPTVDAAQLETIRARHAALTCQWTELAEGMSLELDF